MVREMEFLANNVIQIVNQKPENFKIGFHHAPSMQRLHLHVVSRDFNSICLKHKNHWNSFNTNFFLSVEKVIDELNEKGKIEKPSEEYVKRLMALDLKCNSCEYHPKNMPNLKAHLLTHKLFL